MPEPQMKIRAACPFGEAGRNVNPVASVRTETSSLLRSVFSSTPRVRTELASHDITNSAHRMNPVRIQRRRVQRFRSLLAVESVKVYPHCLTLSIHRNLFHVLEYSDLKSGKFAFDFPCLSYIVMILRKYSGLKIVGSSP